MRRYFHPLLALITSATNSERASKLAKCRATIMKPATMELRFVVSLKNDTVDVDLEFLVSSLPLAQAFHPPRGAEN